MGIQIARGDKSEIRVCKPDGYGKGELRISWQENVKGTKVVGNSGEIVNIC